MNQAEWIVAAVVAAIIIFVFKIARLVAIKSNTMSKFAMTLLPDEFTYRQRRIEFLKLVESLRVDNAAILYHAAMFDLEDVAEKNDATKRIGWRMWQLNQKAIQTGKSITEIMEGGANQDDMPEDEAERYPYRKQHILTAGLGTRIRTNILSLRRLVKRILGV